LWEKKEEKGSSWPTWFGVPCKSKNMVACPWRVRTWWRAPAQLKSAACMRERPPSKELAGRGFVSQVWNPAPIILLKTHTAKWPDVSMDPFCAKYVLLHQESWKSL
jgi:hypothetical protein